MTKKFYSASYYILTFIMVAFCNDFYGYSQKQILIQAETADTIFHGQVNNDDQGFTGAGFLNLDNMLGSYAVWLVNIPKADQYTVTVRYANGSADRPVNILVNNSLIFANLSFPATGSWTDWKTVSFQVAFIKGSNSFKIVGSNPSGPPDLDNISISNPNVDLEVAPAAINDTLNVSPKDIGLISPLNNDYDRNGDVIHIVSWKNPLHGTLDTIQGGKFQFKPELNYLGADSFRYIISDGLKEASALVIININVIDWSVELSNVIINTRSTKLDWAYEIGLLLEGMLRVYKRTNDQRYLTFIKAWAEYHIAADGTINADLNSLDNLMPGYTLLHLYKETKIEKFKLAAEKIRKRFDTFPRNPDSTFWHMTDLNGELWLDGLYMGMPFLTSYGNMFGDEKYAYTEAIRQFKLHINYLIDKETGLLYHAYDYDGSESWALPPYKRSPYVWGRSVGWVVMGLAEILDFIPSTFPQREIIVEQYKTVLKALAKYQDPTTGLWYQIVDHQTDAKNWLETSCTMMFTYSMARAIQKGYLDKSYSKNVDLGYKGVLSKISEDKNKMVFLKDICEGTGVSSDINYYYDRARLTNDDHGLGSFLIMNEMLGYNNMPWLVTKVEETQTRHFSIYPNPCKDYVELSMDGLDKDVKIDIYNISGMKIKTIQVSYLSGPVSIDMSAIPTGIYLLKIYSKSQVYTEKLIRQ